MEAFRSHTGEKLYDGPPDGGYGWWIAAGHFINIGIGYGFTKSFGIFFPYIKEEYSVDNTTTSLVFSIMMFTQYSGSLIGNLIYRQYGPRLTLMIGGILCGSGLILWALLKSLFALYIGVGLFVGLGFSYVILVGNATLSRYFKKRRPQALAFSMTGVPVMSIIFPLIYEFLYETFGMYGAVLIVGAIQLNVCVGAAFFRPINLKSDHTGTAQLSLIKKLSNAFGRLIRNPNFLIPLGGRLCSTKFIREKLGTFETFSLCVVALGCCNLFAPFWVTSFNSFAAYGVIFGLCFGLTIGVEWSNVSELVETDILSDAITFIQLETSIGVLLSPLAGGYISDKTGDYSYVFYIAGMLLLAAAAFAGAVAVRRRCSLKEMVVEEVEPVAARKSSMMAEKDGFEMTNSVMLNAPDGSQIVNSKSFLGVNVAVNPNARFRGKTKEEADMADGITASCASLHA
ncbi:Oidioi.mRNA.OKI2018_I69.PAR.g8817.t1.cds [Oikopleura dioica]|uniref:Oidioi.mRNA.OKI2018_I69.PAR.g8817.t1.cds n=1 Tax=Oikopleura dioica TaxID=34765 RepID=A0ABN7RKC3_OIKDI|nr:Oidioi.mRNA.OKI2018_I69.PAR.g8817.t1.cds [Oikopleura dioica]